MATCKKRGRSYLIRSSLGYTPEGKQVRRSMTWTPDPGMTDRQIEKELNRQMVLFDEQCRGAVRGDGHVKFQTFADEWMRSYGEPTLALQTQQTYRRMLPRINKAIGWFYVNAITPRQIQTFITGLSQPGGSVSNPERGLSPGTVRTYHALLSAIFDYAVKMEMVEKNPCALITLPPDPHKEKKIYTLQEAQAFLDALLARAPLKYQVFFCLALFGGYRREELCGFEFSDFDFDACTAIVRRASVYIAKKGICTVPTKTRQSIRTLKLPEWIFPMIRRLETEQTEKRLLYGDQWHECGRLFTALDGKPINPNLPYDWLRDFCKREKLPFYGIHQFRHLNASLLIDNGESARTVSAMLGHASTTTTMNIYAHSFEAAQARASDALAEKLPVRIGHNSALNGKKQA